MRGRQPVQKALLLAGLAAVCAVMLGRGSLDASLRLPVWMGVGFAGLVGASLWVGAGTALHTPGETESTGKDPSARDCSALDCGSPALFLDVSRMQRFGAPRMFCFQDLRQARLGSPVVLRGSCLLSFSLVIRRSDITAAVTLELRRRYPSIVQRSGKKARNASR